MVHRADQRVGHLLLRTRPSLFQCCLYRSYMAQFHMDRTTVSSIYSLATMIAGILLFGVGKLTDRYGHRVMMTWTAVLLGLACLWNSFAAGTVTLFIGFLMIRLFGQGSMFFNSKYVGFPMVCKAQRPGFKFCRSGRIAGRGCLSASE